MSEDFSMSYGPSPEWHKIQAKLMEIERKINSITLRLCDELEDEEVASLKKERRDLEEEKRYLTRARKAEPIILQTSCDVREMLEQAKAKEDAEEREKNSTH